MTTGYTEPLGAAYRRMKAALFQPFDLGKWFVVGFASWIAGWSTGGSFNFRWPGNVKGNDGSNFPDVGGILADPEWRAALIVAGLLLVALVVVIMWVISRGEFVFLDVVLNGRSAIAEPWRTFRAQGNSLFVWRLVFGLIMFGASAIVLGAIFVLGLEGRLPRTFRDLPWLPLLVGLALAWLPMAVAALYVNLFLRHFVTPIMYRDRSTTTEAWKAFWPILRERLGAFLVYGLFVLGVHIVLFLALIPAILLTCCVLGCLLALPFIGAVVWLPVSYTFRAFGPEFLAQFGLPHNVWPLPVAAPEPPPEVAS